MNDPPLLYSPAAPFYYTLLNVLFYPLLLVWCSLEYVVSPLWRIPSRAIPSFFPLLWRITSRLIPSSCALWQIPSRAIPSHFHTLQNVLLYPLLLIWRCLQCIASSSREIPLLPTPLQFAMVTHTDLDSFLTDPLHLLHIPYWSLYFVWVRAKAIRILHHIVVLLFCATLLCYLAFLLHLQGSHPTKTRPLLLPGPSSLTPRDAVLWGEI